MSQKSLNTLSLLRVGNEITKTIDSNNLIENFTSITCRRIKFSLKF